MWYTIFDRVQPEHYIWAKNITLERLYEMLSQVNVYYGYISVNYIPPFYQEVNSDGRMGVIKSNGTEWNTALNYYTISEFIILYKMDLRRIDLFYIDPIDQNDTICLEAVKRNPSNLYYVVNQTEEICREALRRDGKVLYSVKNKTEEFILLAIETEPWWALQYTPKHEQTRKVCFEAANKDKYAINQIKCEDMRKEIATLFKVAGKF